MKKIKLLPIILILTLLVSALGLPALALEQPEINSPRAVLMDAASGRVFYEKDADSQAYPASLTKVMTVLVAVEAIERGEFSLTDSVTASERCLEGMVDDGSTAGIVPGETMPLQDLLYCALLASANEACNVIAEYVSGSVEAFVEQMNALAAKLGCSGTHFANTHGLPDDDHYTTARDMAVIYREAISHELFAEISGSVGYTVAATNVSGGAAAVQHQLPHKPERHGLPRLLLRVRQDRQDRPHHRRRLLPRLLRREGRGQPHRRRPGRRGPAEQLRRLRLPELHRQPHPLRLGLREFQQPRDPQLL